MSDQSFQVTALSFNKAEIRLRRLLALECCFQLRSVNERIAVLQRQIEGWQLQEKSTSAIGQEKEVELLESLADSLEFWKVHRDELESRIKSYMLGVDFYTKDKRSLKRNRK